ncbi:unnamed protein product [Symbiodinium sp. CCMP2592]|nr:unnamed protein product [Symbiodinium sp. CCMP2592]
MLEVDKERTGDNERSFASGVTESFRADLAGLKLLQKVDNAEQSISVVNEVYFLPGPKKNADFEREPKRPNCSSSPRATWQAWGSETKIVCAACDVLPPAGAGSVLETW